ERSRSASRLVGQRSDFVPRSVRQEQHYPVRLRLQRPELLRRVFQRSRLRHDVATLLHRRGMGSVYGRCLGLLPRLWIHVRIGLPMGMDALSLWKLDDGPGHGMDVAARRME